MRRRRGLQDERALCSGPGKLCEALGITIKHSELPLDAPPFALHARHRQARDRRRRADRHHQGGRFAVALWLEGIEVSEQAVLRVEHEPIATGRCHTPRMRGIQYAADFSIQSLTPLEYWIVRQCACAQGGR